MSAHYCVACRRENRVFLLVQTKVANVDDITDMLEFCDVYFDRIEEVGRKTLHVDRVEIEFDESSVTSCASISNEFDRNLNVDFFRSGNYEEIDVEEVSAHRVVLYLVNENVLLLAVQIELNDVRESGFSEEAEEFGVFNGDVGRFNVVAVYDGRDLLSESEILCLIVERPSFSLQYELFHTSTKKGC